MQVKLIYIPTLTCHHSCDDTSGRHVLALKGAFAVTVRSSVILSHKSLRVTTAPH